MRFVEIVDIGEFEEVLGWTGVLFWVLNERIGFYREGGVFLIVSFFFRFEYLFNFDNIFEIYDDIEVLKRMGMVCGLEFGSCFVEDLKVVRSLVLKALEFYVTG